VGDNLDAQLKRNPSGATAAPITRPIATYGEIFADGSTIELIGGQQGGNPRLLLWHGANETIGPLIKHRAATYQPTQFPDSLLRRLKLLTQCRSHADKDKPRLLAVISKIILDRYLRFAPPR
jgi:hypothetical protein